MTVIMLARHLRDVSRLKLICTAYTALKSYFGSKGISRFGVFRRSICLSLPLGRRARDGVSIRQINDFANAGI